VNVKNHTDKTAESSSQISCDKKLSLEVTGRDKEQTENPEVISADVRYEKVILVYNDTDDVL